MALARALLIAPAAMTMAAAAPAGAQPVVQPGAPGEPSRLVTAEALSHPPPRPGPKAADIRFMQDMIVHHRQAVEMVDLLKTRSHRRDMQLLGDRIAASQAGEIELMRAWLQRQGQPSASPAAMDMRMPADMTMAPMKRMLTPQQMRALAASSGAAFERLFLEGMIRHHEGALDMVHALLAEPGSAEDSGLFEFISDVEADQSAEILRMKSMLSER